MGLWNGSIPQLYTVVVWWSGWGWPHLNQAMTGWWEVFGDGVSCDFGGGGNEDQEVLAIVPLAELIEVH